MGLLAVDDPAADGSATSAALAEITARSRSAFDTRLIALVVALFR